MIDAEKLLEQKPMARMALAAVDQPLVEPITLEEAKKHLRLEGVLDDEDAQIQQMIVAARRLAEGKLNRTITQREITATFDCADGSYPLRKPPFVELIAVDVLAADGTETPVDAADFYLNQAREPYRIYSTASSSWGSQIHSGTVLRVRYIAGYPAGEVPQDIISWMLMQIGSLYAHRESLIAGVSVAPLPEIYERMFLQPYMVYE